MNRQVKGLLGMVLVSLLWAPSFSVTKRILDFLGPISLVSLRFLCAALVLSVLRCLKPSKMKIRKEDRKGAFIIAAMVPMHYVLSNFASLSLHETESIMFSSFQSLLTLVIASLLLNSKISPFTSIYIGIAGIGSVLLMEFQSSLDVVKVGYIIMLAAMIVWVLYCVLLTTLLERYPILDLMYYQCWLTGLALLPWLFLEDNRLQALDGISIGGIGYLSVFCTAVCFLLNARGIRDIGPIPSSLVLIIGPVLVAVLNMAGTGSVLSVRQIAGLILVFGGIVFVTLDVMKNAGKRRTSKVWERMESREDS